MKATLQRRAVDIFAAYLDVPAADQASFLQDRCESTELFETVLALIAADRAADADDFLIARSPRRTTPSQTEFPRIDGYQIEAEIGRGGMGVVYRARSEIMNRSCAIKVITSVSGLHEAADRFRREIEILATLDHPHLVRANHAGVDHDNHSLYLEMELIDGIHVGRLVNSDSTLGVADACEIVRQAAMGVAHAHSRGIIHRDIKPSNIILDRQGNAKVVDLGLARLMTENEAQLTGSGVALGTLRFMPLEQLEDARRADQRSDIYSLCATLYYLLSGEPPYRGANVVEFAVALQLGRPTELDPALGPAPLLSLIESTLSCRIEDRPATCDEFVKLLKPYCRGATLDKLTAVVPSTADDSTDNVALTTSGRLAARRASWLQQVHDRLRSALGEPFRWAGACRRIAVKSVLLTLIAFWFASLANGWSTLDLLFAAVLLIPCDVTGLRITELVLRLALKCPRLLRPIIPVLSWPVVGLVAITFPSVFRGLSNDSGNLIVAVVEAFQMYTHCLWRTVTWTFEEPWEPYIGSIIIRAVAPVSLVMAAMAVATLRDVVSHWRNLANRQHNAHSLRRGSME